MVFQIIVFILGWFGVMNNLKYMFSAHGFRYNFLSIFGLGFGLVLMGISAFFIVRESKDRIRNKR